MQWRDHGVRRARALVRPQGVKFTRQGMISSWHDRKILPGDEWKHHIHDHLETADIILLLISADFIASDYCLDIEVKTALRRHESGEACVIPILLRPVDWTGAVFAKLQALPTHGRPVTMWADRDEAFLDVAQGIRKVAELLRARRTQKFEEKQHVNGQYKQKVEEILSSSSGYISVIPRDTLNELREKLKLTTEEAQAIEARAFEPYKIYEANLEKYKHTLLKVLDQYPFSEEIKKELEYRQRDLGIKSEDVERIAQPLLAPVKAEYDKKLYRYQQEFSNLVQARYPLDQDVRPGLQSLQRSLGLSDDDIAHIEEKVVHQREANQFSTPLVSPLDAKADQQPFVSASTDSQPNRSPRLSLLQKTCLLAGGSIAVVFAVVLTFFPLARTPQHSQSNPTATPIFDMSTGTP
jgi:hypothetical protein